jgi:hypothetical protein
MAATRHEARGAAREPAGSNRDERLVRKLTHLRLEKIKGGLPPGIGNKPENPKILDKHTAFC